MYAIRSYYAFDLSPELSQTKIPETEQARREWVESNIESDLVEKVRKQVSEAGYDLQEQEMMSLLCYVWPSMLKMKIRDEKYRKARESAFTTLKGLV